MLAASISAGAWPASGTTSVRAPPAAMRSNVSGTSVSLSAPRIARRGIAIASHSGHSAGSAGPAAAAASAIAGS